MLDNNQSSTEGKYHYNEHNIIKILETYTIPAQPEIINKLIHGKNTFTLGQVTILVASDVSLAGAVLQVANSPAFLDIIHQSTPFKTSDDAIHKLGLDRTYKIIHTIAIKRRLDDKTIIDFRRFWDSARDVAVVSAYLSNQLMVTDPGSAYMFGLFRDIGIPILIQALGEPYLELLKNAQRNNITNLVPLEDETFGINHQMVGYSLAKRWHVDDIIARAILNHHIVEEVLPHDTSITAKKNLLVTIVHIAELISDRFRALHKIHGENVVHTWLFPNKYIWENLQLEEIELIEIMDDCLEQMEMLLESYQISS